MKKYSKAIAAILAALICLSMCVFIAYADENDAQQGEPGGNVVIDDGGSGGSQASGDGQSEVPYVPDQQSDAGSSDTPYIPESSNVDNGGGDNGGGYDQGYDYNSSSYESDNNNSVVYYDSDGNSYSNQDEVYVGGGQSYQPPVSTAPPAALYEAEKKIDVNELSKNDWGDIANLLKNTGTSESDGDDFAFIQKNTSKTDNGNWIVIAGAVCIALSMAGFVYLIVSTVRRKRKIKAGNITRTSNPHNSGAPRRASNDYNDGYGSSKPAKQQKPEKTGSGHYSAGTKNGKSKGGRRYR